MNTFLSRSQEILKEQYRTFASSKVAPLVQALECQKHSLKEFLQNLGQAGYLGITVPQEYGGQGAPFLNFALFCEAVGEYDSGVVLALASHIAVIEIIKRYGTDVQKSRYLPVLARGESIAALAIGEEGAGTNFEAVATQAELRNSKYCISGKKTWVVNGEIAGLVLTLAVIKGQEKPVLFLVDMDSAELVQISANREKLGMQSALTNDIEFQQLPVPALNLLEPVSETAEQVLYGMDVAKTVIAAAAVGLTENALAISAVYAKNRQQFGKTIGKFQGVQWKIADLAVELAAARLHTYRAAWSKDEKPEEFRCHAAMCKLFAAKVARFHSGEAVQIEGIRGISIESPLERFYRDAKVMEIVEGTSEWQKIQLVKELGI